MRMAQSVRVQTTEQNRLSSDTEPVKSLGIFIKFLKTAFYKIFYKFLQVYVHPVWVEKLP